MMAVIKWLTMVPYYDISKYNVINQLFVDLGFLALTQNIKCLRKHLGNLVFTSIQPIGS